MSGRKESVAQRSFFHLSSMRNLFSYVDTAKVRWNGPKKPDGPTAKSLSEKASAQGPNRGGCQCAGTACPAGTSPTSAQSSGMPCTGTARPTGTYPTSAQSSGMPLSKGAKGRSKKGSQPQTTKHLEKTTKHLEKTTRHLEKTTKHLEKTTKHLEKTTKHLEKTTKHLEKTTKHLEKTKCFVVFVTSKTGFGLRSCYFQAKLGLISPHFSMAGTMLRVTSSSRILHR